MITRRARPCTLLALALIAPPVQAEAEAHAAAARTAAPVVAQSQSPLPGFLEQGKYKEGLEWLRSFGQGTAEQNRYRGLFHHGLGEPDAALKDLVPAYRAQPSDDAVALALAEASLWKKDFKTAASVLGQLKAPEAADALRVRGLMLEQAGKLSEALALYDRAIPRLRQPLGTIERKAQVLSWLKRFDEAVALYREVVRSKQAGVEQRRRCRVRIAEITAWQKDFDGALEQLAALLAEEPRLTDALLLRGQILEWRGEFAEAKRTYSRILAVDSGHAAARLRLQKLLWVE